jgi:Na+/proline symporter
VIVAAIVVPFIDEDVIDIIMVIAGTCLGMLLAIYLLGMFSRRANLPGVLIGVAAGLACFLFVLICTNIPKWWYGAFAMFPTIIIGAIASRCFPAPPESALEDTLLIREKR